MAWTFSENITDAAGTGTSLSKAWPFALLPGTPGFPGILPTAPYQQDVRAYVFVGITSTSASYGTPIVADTDLNTYNLVGTTGQISAAGVYSQSFLFCCNVFNKFNTSPTFTATVLASCDIAFAMIQSFGNNIDGEFDANVTISATSQPVTCTSPNVNQWPDEMILSFGYDATNQGDTWTPDAGFQQLIASGSEVPNHSIAAFYQINSGNFAFFANTLGIGTGSSGFHQILVSVPSNAPLYRDKFPVNINPAIPLAQPGMRNAILQNDGQTPRNVSIGVPNQGGVRTVSGTTDTLSIANNGTITKYTNASTVAVSLVAPYQYSYLSQNFMVYVYAAGAGGITITPTSGTISSGITSGSTLSLIAGQDAVIFWDGTNWTAGIFGAGSGSVNATELQSVPVSATGPTTGQALVYNGSDWIPTTISAGPNPSKRRWAYASSGGFAIGANGSLIGDQFSGVNAGSFNVPTSTVPWPYTNYTQGTTGQQSGTTGASIWRTGNNILWEAKLQLTSVSSVRWSAGMVDSTMTISIFMGADTFVSHNYAAFRFSTNVPDTNFQCIVGNANGSSVQTVDSGVAAVVNTTYLFQIQFNDSTPNIIFSINGSIVATISTNIPSSGVNLQHAEALTPLVTGTKVMNLGWVYMEADN